MGEEFQSYRISQQRHTRPSLYAAQSLLAWGFPLVKNHVLFDLNEYQWLRFAQLEPARWIPVEHHWLLAVELQELFVSPHCSCSSGMG